MEFVDEFSSNEKITIGNEFKRLKNIYLDNAGTSLYGETQLKLITENLATNLYCSPHTSKTTENVIDQVRYKILKHFNADFDEYSVIFTSGATAAFKIVGETFRFGENGSFYYLTDSHTSVLGMREVVNTKNIIPITKDKLLESSFHISTPGFITFPAQCNFNGLKYPLDIINRLKSNPELFVCLDAASFVSTSHLDLKRFKPDFVCFSFYKIFGYPTGLGALIVSKRGADQLEKKYYGGGTIKIALTRTNWHQKRDQITERFEDGTTSFLSIIALQFCFQYMENLLGDNFIHRISRHVFNLGKYLYHQMSSLKHHNNQAVVVFYHDTEFSDEAKQGGIVNFNLRHADGSYVGFAEFSCIAALNNIVLRTGCFCNPGSCQTHLKLSSDELMQQFQAGHVCGDENDLINGTPTGSVRVSFGYMTTEKDVDKLVQVIKECYVETKNNRIILSRNDIKEKYKLTSVEKKPRLKSMRIYPIKSCAPMVIEGSWTINSKGLKYDREWVIVNGANGTSLTQKNETKLCLIQPFIDETRSVLRLKFPELASIEVPLDQKLSASLSEAKLCETKVCGDRIIGWDCGDDVAKWLSDALLIDDLRLMRQKEEGGRKNPTISLSNQAQFLLISEPSVEWLMDQVQDWDDCLVNLENIINRFRGNFVIDGLLPLEENDFKNIRIGKVEFEVQGPCTRCQMICIDQSSGTKTTEPLRTIGKVFKGKMRFGIYLKHNCAEEFIISCGDSLIVKQGQ